MKALPAHLRYMTQFTRRQMAGVRDPQRDMTNHKQAQKPMRTAAWLKRKAEENA